MLKVLLCLLVSTASWSAPVKTARKVKPKSYLTSIGEICEKSNGCKIETVPKNMKVNHDNRSMLVLNEKFERVGGNCLDKRYCKIVVKNKKDK